MKVSKTINLRTADLSVITLHPGDTVPAWAESLITNPRVILADDDAVPAVERTEEHPEKPEPKDYSKVPKPELIALLADRNLPTEGKVAELRARLVEADNTAPEADEDEVDLFDLSREALEELAEKKGIEFDSDLSDEELATLIENHEE